MLLKLYINSSEKGFLFEETRRVTVEDMTDFFKYMEKIRKDLEDKNAGETEYYFMQAVVLDDEFNTALEEDMANILTEFYAVD